METPGQRIAPPTDPDPGFDLDRQRGFQSFNPAQWIDGMRSGVDLDARSEKRLCADSDASRVQEEAIHIDVDLTAKSICDL